MDENKLRLVELMISLGRDHGMSEMEIEEACASLEAHGAAWSAWEAALYADDNRQPPRRHPRREGYERDDSYVGMSESDIARSRWVAGVDDEIHTCLEEHE